MNTHDKYELPAEFRSGNNIPVERATITRERMLEILQAAIEADRKRTTELLKNPVHVHTNMCRGIIAPITFDMLAHVLGEEATQAWLKRRGEPVKLDRYDAGLLGGQDGMPAYVWHDIIRSELDRAYDFYMDQIDRAVPQPAEPCVSSVSDKTTCGSASGDCDSQPAEPVSLHPDDAAVDAFAAEMKAKLAKKRADGRAGWQECTSEYLSGLLREHVEKGDPLDVANLAMMLHQNGQSIVSAEPVKKKDWNVELSSWSDEDFVQVFHERPDLADRLRRVLAEPVKKKPYAQGSALGEFGIIPMCDQVNDEPVKVPSDLPVTEQEDEEWRRMEKRQ